MTRWKPAYHPKTDRLLQSGVPTGPDPIRPGGLNLRGVVVAVYVFDDDGYPQPEDRPNTVLVDVLTYGEHNTYIPRVPWTYERSGLHEGDVSLPRAATIDTEGDLNLLNSNPRNLDGDHVIVSFIENSLNQPYISRSIGHPSSDRGNAAKPVTQRLRLVRGDGHPRLWKHRGAAFGFDRDGQFLLDTRGAHSGEYRADGTEPDPTENGSNGNVLATLQPGSAFRVTGGETVEVQNTGDTVLDTDGSVLIGTGASHPIVHGDTYQTDQGAKNQAIAQAMLQLQSAMATAVGSLGSPATAPLPVVGADLVPILAAIQVAALAVQTAVVQYDAAIGGQLSGDVRSK